MPAIAAGVHMPDKPGTATLQDSPIEIPARPNPAPSPGASSPADIPPEEMPLEEMPGEARVPSSPGQFLPPLCAEDCLRALQWILAMISAPRQAHPAAAGPSASEIAGILAQVHDYMRILDSRHSTLAGYSWTPIDDKRVRGDEPRNREFNPKSTIERVNAISISATGGDVVVYEVSAVDRQGARTDFHLDPPAIVRAELPRREVFHFYFPIDIERVIVRCAPDAAGLKISDQTRLHAFAGKTRRRQYLKEAQFFLRRAAGDFEAGDPVSAGDWLRRAANRIERFDRQMQR